MSAATEFVRLVDKVESAKDLLELNTATKLLQDFLSNTGEMNALRNHLSLKLRDLMVKEKMTKEDKSAATTILSFLLKLDSDRYVAALKNHDDMIDYCKSILIKLAKVLVTLGITLIK